MPLLGLLNTEDFGRFTNIRRRVFYHWPNGAAPLTGLLSMLEGEELNDPEFSWWEKRLPEITGTTAAVAAGANGPFSGSGAAVADSYGTVLRTGGAGIDAGGAPGEMDKFSMTVTSSSGLRAGMIIQVRNMTLTGSVAWARQNFRIEAVDTDGANIIRVKVSKPLPSVGFKNDTTINNGLTYTVIGNAFYQGETGVTAERYTLPINPANWAQIFRTPFSLTGTALHTSAKFDESGPYKDKAKEASLQHMCDMERSFLFGGKSKDLESNVPIYLTGGILWFLTEWELSGGGTTGYRPGGAALTADTDDDKRIITNSSGVLSHKTYNTYLERLFRVTNNIANEKLCLCGSGFLSVINQMYAQKTTLSNQQGSPTTYGMTVTTHETPFGTVHYKTHPLFSQNSTLRYNAMFVDVQNLRFRYVQGRDTQLLKNRQNNGDDFRRDEWLSEAGLELRFPESFMYLQNVQDFAP